MSALYDMMYTSEPLPLILSIRNHLHRLFNAKQGSLFHLPDYGMPDIGKIYQGLPYTLQHLKKSLVHLVEHYEPRLFNVHIQETTNHDNATVLCLNIAASLRSNERIIFETYFISGGKIVVQTGS